MARQNPSLPGLPDPDADDLPAVKPGYTTTEFLAFILCWSGFVMHVLLAKEPGTQAAFMVGLGVLFSVYAITRAAVKVAASRRKE